SLNELYVAVKGGGAFCNGQPVSVTSETKLSNVLVAHGLDGHQDNPDLTRKEASLLAEIALAIRNLRSSKGAFDEAMVTKGVYGASLNRTSRIWDNVAQQVVIEEAGGLYTDFYGQPMDYSNLTARVGQNFTMCAAPPEIHRQLQEIIHAHEG